MFRLETGNTWQKLTGSYKFWLWDTTDKAHVGARTSLKTAGKLIYLSQQYPHII